MGEDKNFNGGKGEGGCVRYVLLICCSNCGNLPFFASVFPIPDLGL